MSVRVISKKTVTSFILLFFLFPWIRTPASAKPPLPLPREAFDGGAISAETLGRGGTIASNRGSPASGSENPASLASGFANSLFTTVLIGHSSSLPDEAVETTDPLFLKTIHYIAIGAQKGVLFYEPLGRRRERQVIDPSSPSTDYRDIEFSANAIGFAGVNKFGSGGDVGLSLAYLWSSLASSEYRTGQQPNLTSDTLDGIRLHIGLRHPTGPTMWGLNIHNAPGFLWGKDYKRQMLPVKVRLGNTWRAKNGMLFSIDGERRYYNEGSDTKDFVFVGNETFLSQYITLRFGAFGEHIDVAQDRHLSTGATIRLKTGTALTYAYEVFELNKEKVKRSLMSIQMPFTGGETEN